MKEQLGDVREFLKKKLGEEGFAKFQEGIRLAAKARREKGAGAEVEGQSPSCPAHCASYCDANSFLQSGSYSSFSFD